MGKAVKRPLRVAHTAGQLYKEDLLSLGVRILVKVMIPLQLLTSCMYILPHIQGLARGLLVLWTSRGQHMTSLYLWLYGTDEIFEGDELPQARSNPPDLANTTCPLAQFPHHSRRPASLYPRWSHG